MTGGVAQEALSFTWVLLNAGLGAPGEEVTEEPIAQTSLTPFSEAQPPSEAPASSLPPRGLSQAVALGWEGASYELILW